MSQRDVMTSSCPSAAHVLVRGLQRLSDIISLTGAFEVKFDPFDLCRESSTLPSSVASLSVCIFGGGGGGGMYQISNFRPAEEE